MNNKKRIWIIICVVVAAAVIGYLIIRENRKTDTAFTPDLDPNAVSQTQESDSDKPEGIRIPGYPQITIAADETEVEMNLKNPEGNPCYFTFEIVLEENDETIYTSKMVEPGKAITDVTLSHALEKGEYPAVIRITTTSLEDGSQMNGANVETTLIAE